MRQNTKAFLIKAFSKSMTKTRSIDFDAPIITYEEAGTHFQSLEINDAKRLNFIRTTVGGFYFQKEYIGITMTDFYEYLKK